MARNNFLTETVRNTGAFNAFEAIVNNYSSSDSLGVTAVRSNMAEGRAKFYFPAGKT